MRTNPVPASDDFMLTMMQRSIEDAVDQHEDEDLSEEQLVARAQMRFLELTKPSTDNFDAYIADSVSETLVQVAERHVVTAGAEPFSVDTVVKQAMAKLERTFGRPHDADLARAAILAYLDEAHGLPQ